MDKLARFEGMDEIISLNVEDLDVQELERRLELTVMTTAGICITKTTCTGTYESCTVNWD